MKTVKIKAKTNVIIGKMEADDVATFLGIPYAESPVGDLRWKKAVSLADSEKELEAFTLGDSGLQPIDEVEAASLHTQSEDCLKLNVWSRFTGSSKKPVMVFIHGGSYMSGGTADPMYDGHRFAADNDVVFVSINYRLSVLSAINLTDIGGGEYENSGQLGLLDQICALKWINENIEAFGGDKDNITIFGESCGGGSVSLLMTMPEAKGLFQKVIAQSGATNLKKSSYLAKLIARDFAKKAQCNTMEELLNLSDIQIRKIIDDFPLDYGYKFSIMFAPEADGQVLPIHSIDTLKDGCAKDIKLMLGTNANEFNYWKLYIENIGTEMPKFLADQLFIQGIILHYQEEAIKKFFEYRKDWDSDDTHIAVADEVLFRLPAIEMAEAQSKYNDTYMYYFTWESNIEGFKSCHALELPFVFNNIDCPSSETLTGPNAPRELAKKMQASWAAFATTGDPNNNSIPKWEKFDDNNRNTMIINTAWENVKDPEKESRKIISKMFY